MRGAGTVGALLLLVSCEGTITVGGAPAPLDEQLEVTTPQVPTIPPLPSAAVCSNAPSGRGYRGLAGEVLEAGRPDVAALLDNHRPYRNRFDPNSPYWMVITEIARTLGVNNEQDPESTSPGVGSAFGVIAPSWYEESEVGAFAVYVTFRYAAKACERAAGVTQPSLKTGWLEHMAFPPTEARATAFCTRTMRAAWLRAPTADELQPCVQLALTLEEPDVKKRWALVCASVFASPNFLAN